MATQVTTAIHIDTECHTPQNLHRITDPQSSATVFLQTYPKTHPDTRTTYVPDKPRALPYGTPQLYAS
jgi:hypothetical protein